MANTHSGLSTLYVNMPCLFRYLQFLYQTCILHHFMLLFHVLDKKWIIDLFIPSVILNSKLTPIMFYKLRQMKFMFQILLIFHNPRYRTILYNQSKNWKLHCIQSNLQHLLVKRNTSSLALENIIWITSYAKMDSITLLLGNSKTRRKEHLWTSS